ncbi:hypothetical protein ACFO3J_00700 [Streptomyces polygonati]|uniref:Uncharacterized protein n=1 Tax=Streptomyces polygonati TaxID=1617087 RepID=A0ABV8HG05_9ACTN
MEAGGSADLVGLLARADGDPGRAAGLVASEQPGGRRSRPRG